MTVKRFGILCLENPLLDIQVHGTEELLLKYGLQANNAIPANDSHAELYDDLLTNHDAKLFAGGAVQNSARGAQYILPPDSVVFLGSVGDDGYSTILRQSAEAAGLRVEYRVAPQKTTGRCGVIITGHSRSLCSHLGAANDYGLDHLKSPEIWQLVEQAEIYFTGGFHFGVCPAAVMELAEHAAKNDKVFVLSLSACFVLKSFREIVDAIAPYCDYVVCNEAEVASYAVSHGSTSHEPRKISQEIANLPKTNGKRKRVTIVTQGTQPTLVAVQGNSEVMEFPVRNVPSEQIKDTNGAGDAFAGGLLAGILLQKDLEICVDIGHWLASLSVQESGPSYPIPRKRYLIPEDLDPRRQYLETGHGRGLDGSPVV